MTRLSILTSVAAVLFAAGAMTMNAAADAGHPTAEAGEFYELRAYTFSSAEQQKLVEQYWAEAAIPGLKRQGIGPVGVFKEMETQEGQAVERIFVLIRYEDMAAFKDVHERLIDDAAYATAAAPYLEAARENPAFVRIESSLLQSFAVHPKIRVPDTSKPRIFEMREYEGHSEIANDQKMFMFNDVEADIFEAAGLTGVFYAKTVIGKNRPSLHYMVVFADMEEHAKDWAAFRAHPRWAAAQQSDKYAGGNLSGRSGFMLVPLACSQI